MDIYATTVYINVCKMTYLINIATVAIFIFKSILVGDYVIFYFYPF